VSASPSSQYVCLAYGDYSLDVLPALGGAVAGLRFRGLEVLRRTPPGIDEPLASSGFALVPFANRIAHGRFRFGATEVRLDRNAPDQAHPLHGQAWRHRWSVESCSSREIALTYAHAPGQWPWRYAARQVLTLDADGLRVQLSLVNRAAAPMPAGLGWHPYFHRSPRMRLRTEVTHVWLTDAECLPTQCAPGTHFGDWQRAEALPEHRLIDHCFGGWSGRAELDWPEEALGVRLRADGPLRWLHVFVPPGGDFLCLEPVSHMPDALNRPEPPEVTGLRVLAPGETLAATIRLGVVPGPCAG
jgi:aldose 1-epimerase